MATAELNMHTMQWDESDPSKVDVNTHVARLHTEVVHLRRDVVALQAQLAALTTKEETNRNDVLAHVAMTRDELLAAFNAGALAVRVEVERLLGELAECEPAARVEVDASGISELAYAVMVVAAAHGLTVDELRARIAYLRARDEQLAAKILGPLAPPVALDDTPNVGELLATASRTEG